MATFFRKCIAQKVLSAIEGYKTKTDNFTASLVKVNHKSRQSQMIFPLKRFLEKRESRSSVDASVVLKTIRSWGLPTAEGITDVQLSDSSENLIFAVDQTVFNRIVLLDVCVNLDKLDKHSCLFQNFPHKNVVVEFRAPNLGQRFTIAHLRSSIYSNFIARMCKYVGHNVTHLCLFEDWGYRASLLLTGYQEFGIEDEVQTDLYNHLPEVLRASYKRYMVDTAFQEKVRRNMKKLKEGDPEILLLWSKLQKTCIKENNKIYTRLGIASCSTFTDSMFHQRIDKIYDELLEKEFIIEESHGVKVNVPLNHDFDSDKLLKITIGSPAYSIARDVAVTLECKEKYNFDSMYCITDESRRDDITYLLSMLKAIGCNWYNELFHIILKSVKFFNMKKGQVFVETVLDRAKLSILKELKLAAGLELNENADEIADILGITSILVSDMINRKNDNYDFNWGKILQFDGKTGISLQFCYAGLKGIQDDSEIKFKFDANLSPLIQREAHRLIIHLARFDEVVYRAYSHFEPRFLLEYLFDLKYFTEEATNVLKLDIKEDKLTVIKARLLLFYATKKVLQQGLQLLGIQPLEKL